MSTIYDNGPAAILDTSNQPGVFYAKNRTWVYYHNNSDLVYSTSSDNGLTWDNTVILNADVVNCRDFDWYYHSTTDILHYTHGIIAGDLMYYRATINANGTIYPIATYTVDTASDTKGYPNIGVDSDDYPYIAHGRTTSFYAHIYRADNTLGSSWTDTELDSSTGMYGFRAVPFADNRRLYAFWAREASPRTLYGAYYDGSSWNPRETPDPQLFYVWTYDSFIDSNGTLHLLSENSSDYRAIHRQYNTVTHTWGSSVDVETTDVGYHNALALSHRNDEMYYFWGNTYDVFAVDYSPGSGWSNKRTIATTAQTVMTARMWAYPEADPNDIIGVVFLQPGVDLLFASDTLPASGSFEITDCSVDTSYVIRTGENTILVVADFTDPDDLTAGDYKCYMWFRNNNTGDPYTIGPYEATVGKNATEEYSATLALDPTTEWVRNYDVSIAVDRNQ